jgi:hypothetical protein
MMHQKLMCAPALYNSFQSEFRTAHRIETCDRTSLADFASHGNSTSIRLKHYKESGLAVWHEQQVPVQTDDAEDWWEVMWKGHPVLQQSTTAVANPAIAA